MSQSAPTRPTAGGEITIGSGAKALPEPHHTIQIGDGCHLVDGIESWDIVMAAAPDPDGRFASLRLTKDGEIWINGKLIGADDAMTPVVETLRIVVNQMWAQHVLEEVQQS
jgi:hypothetical protein